MLDKAGLNRTQQGKILVLTGIEPQEEVDLKAMHKMPLLAFAKLYGVSRPAFLPGKASLMSILCYTSHVQPDKSPQHISAFVRECELLRS